MFDNLLQLVSDNWNAVNHLTLQGIPMCAIVLLVLFAIYSIPQVRRIRILRTAIWISVIVFPFAYAYWLWVDGNCGSFSQLFSVHWDNNPQRQYESAGLFGYSIVGWIFNCVLLESMDS